jgi:hypothetical protein
MEVVIAEKKVKAERVPDFFAFAKAKWNKGGRLTAM